MCHLSPSLLKYLLHEFYQPVNNFNILFFLSFRRRLEIQDTQGGVPHGGDYEARCANARQAARQSFSGGGVRALFSPLKTSSPKEAAAAAPAQRAAQQTQPPTTTPRKAALRERNANVPASSKGAPPLPPLEVAAIQAPPPPPPPQQQQQAVTVQLPLQPQQQQQLTSAQALQVESQLPAQIMEVPSLDYVVEDISNLSLVTHPDAQQQQQQQELFGLENNDPLFSQVSYCICFPLLI